MFNLLVSASLRNRLLVLAAAFILVGYGALTLRNLPVDVFPDLNRPIVTLVTEAQGLAPEAHSDSKWTKGPRAATSSTPASSTGS